MVFSKHYPLLLNISAQRISFYTQSFSTILQSDFPTDVVKDLEIINLDAFQQYLISIIETNKLTATEVFVVIDTTLLFEKELPAKLSPDQLEREQQQFFEFIPFQDTVQKNYQIETGTRLIATNKTIIETVRFFFEERGFTVESITPISLLSKQPSPLFTQELARQLLKKTDLLKKHSLTSTLFESVNPEKVEEAKSDKKKTILLIGIFLVLLAILGVVSYVSLTRPPEKTVISNLPVIPFPTKVASTSATLTTTVSPSASSSSQLIPTVATKEAALVSVRIFNGSGIPGQADSLKKELTKAGFTSVVTGNATSITANKTLLLFSSSVKPTVREVIIKIVQKEFPDLVVKDGQETASDVTITTAQP